MPGLLVVAFIVVPIAEIYVIVQLGHVLGLPLTLALLLVDSVLGAVLAKREGMRAWRALRAVLGTGRVPGRELADAALVLVGGVLLLTPGFLSDVLGFFLVLPPTRAVARGLLLRIVVRRMRPQRRARRRFRPAGRTIDGEVVSGGRSGGPRSSGG